MLKYLFCFLLSICLTSCGSKEPEKPQTPPVDVTEFVVTPKNLPAVFDFIGFAASPHPVQIRARVEGYLDKIAYEEGKPVKTGDLLFQLDPKQYEAAVEQARGEVMRQGAILENAKLTVQRLKPLYEQKAASKKDLDNAMSQELASAASLQSAKANLLSAQINLGYCTITSPIDGLTAKAQFYEGALINPASNSLLTTVSVIDPIWVYFTISDNDILRATQQEMNKQLILPGQKLLDVEAIMSDGSVYPYKGKVDYSAPTYDQSTGTMQARAVFPNPKYFLRPGQFMRVKVYGAERPHAIFVPQRALLQKKNGMFVYLIKNGKVVEQDVSTGAWYGDYQIITNGLKAGDHIVVDGINKIRPNSAVNVTGPWKPPQTTPSSTP